MPLWLTLIYFVVLNAVMVGLWFFVSWFAHAVPLMFFLGVVVGMFIGVLLVWAGQKAETFNREGHW